MAERCSAFGMTVSGVDVDQVPMTSHLTRLWHTSDLLEALSAADVVLCAIPYSPANDKLFGVKEFAGMKKGAYFINVSRGRIVDTDALVEAIFSGHLGGAGLDVTDPEPLPKGHPLFDHPDVVITPHIAGLSDQNRARSLALIELNIRCFIEGWPLQNIVRKDVGF